MSYIRAIASSVGQGLLTGAWIAARELPPAQRRVARATAVGAVVAAGWFSTPAGERRHLSWAPGEGIEVVEGEGEESRPPMDKRRIAVVVAAGVLSVPMLVGRHQLEKRWLAGLQRNGHAHPHRALALRMAALTIAAKLPSRLLEAHETRTKSL